MKYYDYTYSKGDILPDQVGAVETQIFDLFDTGAYLFIKLPNPTKAEIDAMTSGEVRLTCIPGILWLTFKFGELGWSDCPYTPHLSTQATNLIKTLQASCSHMTIVMVNTVNGEVVYSGTIEFSEAFSASLRTGVMLILAEEFNKDEHYLLCQTTEEKYTSEQIAKSAVVAFKFTNAVVVN